MASEWDCCLQVKAWQELLLAAIGEQLSLSVHPDDEVCGVSVRIRWDSDVIQIWNQDSELQSSAKVRLNGCGYCGNRLYNHVIRFWTESKNWFLHWRSGACIIRVSSGDCVTDWNGVDCTCTLWSQTLEIIGEGEEVATY